SGWTIRRPRNARSAAPRRSSSSSTRSRSTTRARGSTRRNTARAASARRPPPSRARPTAAARRRATARRRRRSRRRPPRPRALERPAPAPPGQRFEREQQHDGADDGEQERLRVPAEVHLVAEHDLADQSPNERADDPDRDRREAADPVPPGHDDPRDRAGQET